MIRSHFRYWIFELIWRFILNVGIIKSFYKWLIPIFMLLWFPLNSLAKWLLNFLVKIISRHKKALLSSFFRLRIQLLIITTFKMNLQMSSNVQHLKWLQINHFQNFNQKYHVFLKKNNLIMSIAVEE